MTVESGQGWEVDDQQVRDFAAAVEDVRRNLNAVHDEVDALSSPEFQPMLGTSPVGQELAAKFTDRMTGPVGLRAQLQTALQRMDEFVASAERSAASYQQTDESAATGYRYS